MSTLHHHRSRPRRLLLDPSSSSSTTTPSPSSSTTTPGGPANGLKPHGLYPNEANFDTNMVIILAALLCALIFALGLNSIVRCALRCSRRFAFENPDETAARLAATGLKKSILRQIPIVAYGSGAHVSATDCPICLGEFLDGQKVRVLPKCNHGFHVRCIDTWFLSHSSCPTCRHSLLEPSPAAAASDNSTEVGADNGNAASGGQGDHHEPIAVDEAS